MAFLIDILDEAVRWVEERYSRRTAWMTAIGGLILIFAIIAFSIWIVGS